LEVNEFDTNKHITKQLQNQIKQKAQWGVHENP
jgi:hypothetical protein